MKHGEQMREREKKLKNAAGRRRERALKNHDVEPSATTIASVTEGYKVQSSHAQTFLCGEGGETETEKTCPVGK